MEEVQKVLDELKGVRPAQLTGEAKRLFEAIMKIADEKDELLKERQADKEKIKKLESDNYECNNIIIRYMEELEIKDKMIDLMSEHLTTPIHSKKDVIKYFENLAKESGEIDEGR